MRAHLLSGDDQVVVFQLEVDDVVLERRLREAAVFRGHVHHDRDLAGVAMDERGWRSAAREQIPREQTQCQKSTTGSVNKECRMWLVIKRKLRNQPSEMLH